MLNVLVMLSTMAMGADKDLTLHATFDKGIDADYAKGDARLYTAPNYKEQDAAKAGLHNPDIELVKGSGRNGSNALRFKKKNIHAVFFRGKDNVAFDPKNWSGTIAFWLSLDPETDLEPGFCDPIQVTDKAYNDSAIWTDFTKDDKPRHFRMGVFGNLKAWNPENLPVEKYPQFEQRLVIVKNTPFAKGKWTHVAVSFKALGSGKGEASLYLNGKLQGTSHISEAFEWDMAKAAVRLGVNYVGLLDEVSVYSRPFSAAEIEKLAR